MADGTLDLRPDEARRLLNVARTAARQNFLKSAAKVILMISLGEFELAVAYIDREALVKWPKSAMLRAFRGMALIRMGRKDAARDCLLEAAQSSDTAAANLAKGLLD